MVENDYIDLRKLNLDELNGETEYYHLSRHLKNIL